VVIGLVQVFIPNVSLPLDPIVSSALAREIEFTNLEDKRDQAFMVDSNETNPSKSLHLPCCSHIECAISPTSPPSLALVNHRWGEVYILPSLIGPLGDPPIY
jgi:hypothetical protein